jgi:group I intron endonuclease
MSYGIIYLFRNKANGKVYIGQTTKDIAIRTQEHLVRAHTYRKNQFHFHLALAKYGIEGFEISAIDSGSSKNELDEKEICWISFYDSINPAKGYNSRSSGSAGKPNEETRRRISESEKGKVLSIETRKKLSESSLHLQTFLGKSHTEETKEKIRVANLGRKRSEEALKKTSDARQKVWDSRTEDERRMIIEKRVATRKRNKEKREQVWL